ncbi:hypothetical protein HLB10_11995, partial [Cellulomonas fimi]
VALALAGGRTVPWRELAGDVWPDDGPADPRAALQTVVSRTRAATSHDVVASHDGGYALAGDSDLALARRHADEGRTALADARPSDALDTARSGLALWRGTPGADVADASPVLAEALAGAAAEVRGALRGVEVDALLALARPQDALGPALAAAQAAPTDEDVHLRLMRAQHAAGRTTDALRTFARLRAALADELGVDPRADVTAFNARLVTGDAPDAATDAATGTQPPGGVAGAAVGPRDVHDEPAGLPGRPPRAPVGLRAAARPLLGRADDLAAVDELLSGARLVTVLGTGGLGKTSLALEVARRRRDAEWVVVVELAGVRTDADVDVALADALGLGQAARSARLGDRLAATPDVRARAAERLAEGPALLVLDNCEHVVAGAAGLADDLLGAVAGLHVLTTSRTPLLVRGEQVHALAPLGVDDDGHGAAVDLFVERALAARPGATLPRDVVARVVSRLDGLPLAIELAAARVRTMTVEEVERRLDARFSLLRSGERLAPDRHRTLEAVIDWSWNLLTDAEQRVLRRLSVLPDGFGLDAAQAIGALTAPGAAAGGTDAWDVLDALDGLVLQSLCTVAEDRHPEGDGLPGVRYRMLETVREFGQLRLADAGETVAAHDAMLAWAAAFARTWSPALVEGDQPAAMRAVRAEQDNLLLALRTALDTGRRGEAYALYVLLGGHWSLRGAYEQVHGLGVELLGRTHGWRVDAAFADVAALALVWVTGMGVFGEGTLTARAVGRLRVVARALDGQLGPRTRAFVRLALAGSVPAAARELAVLRRSPDTYLAMLGHMLSAQLAENSGRVVVARRWVEVAHGLAVGRGDVWAEANNASFLGQIASEEGNPRETLAWAARARAGLRRIVADEELTQITWLELAGSVGAGDADRAEALCDELTVTATTGRAGGTGWAAPEITALALAGRGELAVLRGDVAAGLAHLQAAHATFGAVDSQAQASPWFVMVSAGWVARLVLAPASARVGQPDVAEPARALARHVREWAFLRSTGVVDHPVLGTAAVALGTAAWADGDDAAVDDGLELFWLAELLGSRQDLPMLRRAPLEARARRLVGDARVEDARRRARAVGRRGAAERAFALVASLWC